MQNDASELETKTTPPLTIRAQALEARGLGLSVLPIRADGSKSPTVPSWKEYEKRLYTNEELEGDWTFLGNGVQ